MGGDGLMEDESKWEVLLGEFRNIDINSSMYESWKYMLPTPIARISLPHPTKGANSLVGGRPVGYLQA